MITGFLSLSGVQFAYPTRPDEPVLQRISVEIPAQRTVAFVGPRCVRWDPLLFC